MQYSIPALTITVMLTLFPSAASAATLAQCNTESGKSTNLLDKAPEQRIVAASSRQWSKVVPSQNDDELSGLALEAGTAHSILLSFPDEKWAKLTCLRIELPTYESEKLIPRVALSVAQEKPTEAFRLLGVYSENPEYMEGDYLQLPIDKVVARFLRVQILTPNDTEISTKIGRFQLMGKSLSESEPPPNVERKHSETNLIALTEGARLAGDSDKLWEGVIDGREAFSGPFPISKDSAGTIALADGKKTITGFSVYIPQASIYNLAKVEIQAGKPEDGELKLETLGTFEIANLRFFDNPMQYFALPETGATHIRFVPLASHGAEELYIRELRVHGY